MENQNKIQKTNSTDDIVRMGKVFFESKMFSDLSNMAMAIVKVQAGAELGIPPFQAISGVHIIKGKAVIGAGIMASMVDRHPEYDYEVLQQSDDVCEIKFYKNGKVRGTSKFSKEDAQRAGTQNMGKFPANMLYARAMSNGVKFYAPGVFAGPVYVPEEMGEVHTEEATYEEMPPQKIEAPAPAPAPSEKQMQLIGNLINSHHIPEDYKERPQPETAAEASEVIKQLEQYIAEGIEREKGPATPEQVEAIACLLDNDVFSPEETDKGLAKLAKGYNIANANKAIATLEKTIQEREKLLNEA